MHCCFSLHSVQLRETARNFFEKELGPHTSDIDRDNDFPKFRVREAAKLATLVAEGGGVKGRDSSNISKTCSRGWRGQREGSSNISKTCSRGWRGQREG